LSEQTGKLFLRAREVANLLGFNTDKVRELTYREEDPIPAIKFPHSKQIVYYQPAIYEWAAHQKPFNI
jgi:hypothetical protein